MKTHNNVWAFFSIKPEEGVISPTSSPKVPLGGKIKGEKLHLIIYSSNETSHEVSFEEIMIFKLKNLPKYRNPIDASLIFNPLPDTVNTVPSPCLLLCRIDKINALNMNKIIKMLIFKYYIILIPGTAGQKQSIIIRNESEAIIDTFDFLKYL